MITIDTHIAIWLYENKLDNLTSRAKEAIENNQIILPNMVRLELSYLYEIKRIKKKPETVINTLSEEIFLITPEVPMSLVVSNAQDLTWTRDPFDRIICAETLVHDARLVTHDGVIRRNFEFVIWD